jgi:hypothetical protein
MLEANDMLKWNRVGIALATLVLALAAGGGAYAMWGSGDDDSSAPSSERQADQDDVLGGDGGIAGICLEGAEDCIDTPDGAPAPGLGICAPDVPDCVDVVVGEQADCAPDQVCTDPGVQCDGEGCAVPPCTVPEPSIDAEATLTPEELERIKTGCDDPPVPCEDTPEARCLPPDCAVSSDGSVACPGNEGSGRGTGSSEPGSGAVNPPEGDPDEVMPMAPEPDPAR